MKRTLVLAFLCAGVLQAQDAGKIAGRVRDQESKEPLPGVNVVVKGTRLGGTTDVNGEYFILNVPPGMYDVTARLVGYQVVTQQNVEVSLNRTTTVTFALTLGMVEGKEVVVIAERPDVVREKTSTSEIIRAEEVLLTPGIRDLTDMLTLSSDITDGHFRGGREGEELYNLSGMGIVNPLYSASAFAPIMSAVEEVEVITSGFGAQYGNAQSGVVNISMKEGRSDRWRGRAELRTRMPGYKHFGANIYDPAAQPYLQLLNSPEKWRGLDTLGEGTGLRYYSSFGNGFDNRFGRDTVTLSQIAYILWRYQGRRDVNRSYNNLMDYSTDFTAGGPMLENARIFLAGHTESEWLFLPTPDPDVRRQFMGNVVFDLPGGMSLRFSGAISNRRENLLRSLSTTGFYSWLWDRAIGVSRTDETTTQAGVRFVHALSPSTFYEVKVNRLATDYKDGSPVVDPSAGAGDYSKLMSYPYSNVPDNFVVGSFDNDFRSEKTRTISLDGSFNSQVTTSHLVTGGVQANLYDIDVYNRTNITSSTGGERDEIYQAKPFEIGLFVNDKMEFEGMIANIGLRFDLWNQNVDYYTDLFSPFRTMVSDSSFVYDRDQAPKRRTPTLGRLQPRAGISFPVSVSTVFHVNYGSFVQRPAFQYTISSQLPRIGFARMQIGNPRLEAQETNSYDVGVTQALGEGFTLDVSGYYKDVKNLIERAYFTDVQQTQYSTFVNRDYADIRGFRVSLAKRRGWITGTLNYTYSVATGKSSTPFNASPVYSETPGGGSVVVLPSPKDITLDFDRTHNLVANIGLRTGEESGLWLGYESFLDDITIAVTSFARSGRPYTYDREGLGLVNNRRTPAEYNTNLKISKRIRRFFGVNATLYAEIFNLFNQQIYSYNRVFQSSTAASGSTYINRNIEKYETDPSSLQYFDDFAPFLVDQTFLLYSNEPRSVYFGVIINF